jgi:hypothetical protein
MTKIVVVMFQPRLPGEPSLSLAAQIHEIIGPFSTVEQADEWIREWQTAEAREREMDVRPGQPPFTFYITEVVPSSSFCLGQGDLGTVLR